MTSPEIWLELQELESWLQCLLFSQFSEVRLHAVPKYCKIPK